jgi:predicted nucleotidyltransferase
MSERPSQEQIAVFRRAAVQREEARREAAVARHTAALAVARTAADLLKRDFGARRVMVYGSTARGLGFHADSDIDLVAEGIPAEFYWRAWNAVDALDPAFEVNLIDWEDATPALRADIARDGIEL